MTEEKKQRKPQIEEKNEAILIRILGKDIQANKKVLPGLRQIKGISWSFSKGLCEVLGINKDKKISDLSDKEKTQIEEFIKNPKLPSFMLNRQKDFDDGNNMHIHGEDIKLKKEFDIKRLKKIKSFKGQRHALGQPVRGQRTKSHFRTNRKKSGAVGVQKKKPTVVTKEATKK